MNDQDKSSDWLDVLALTIATFQVLAPMLLAMAGAVMLIYLALWFMSR